ncbi:type I restriction-modification enzyme R subunit C-terminal domain-containing protein [Afifella sp. IM 167]|uniref:type I restriction-modification enzyme R subunit C-terminal domain-containing protein n=1 Tax=Afifella sp. IM 167 TaxID=2033586 RepID=UPI00351DA19E
MRSLVGLDRGAVNAAFSDFVATGTADVNQIEFIDMVIEHLTRQSVMSPELLYESPFTDVAPSGPEEVFDIKRTDRLLEVIKELNATAVA